MHSRAKQTPLSAPMRILTQLLIALMLVSLAGGALAAKKKRGLLDRNQYAYSAAIRWGDFEGAWSMVDPKVRQNAPMTDLDFSRYEQIQVAGYRDLASMPGPDGSVLREIQIEVINRNTLSQRRVRYTEIWRYDPETKNWWIAGLPDFWQGK
jgi:hypothetical protein